MRLSCNFPIDTVSCVCFLSLFRLHLVQRVFGGLLSWWFLPNSVTGKTLFRRILAYSDSKFTSLHTSETFYFTFFCDSFFDVRFRFISHEVLIYCGVICAPAIEDDIHITSIRMTIFTLKNYYTSPQPFRYVWPEMILRAWSTPHHSNSSFLQSKQRGKIIY